MGKKVEPTFKDPIGDVGPVKAFIRTQRTAAQVELLRSLLVEIGGEVPPPEDCPRLAGCESCAELRLRHRMRMRLEKWITELEGGTPAPPR
jgi:hypothetical protein